MLLTEINKSERSMKIKIVTLSLLTCGLFTGMAMANEHNTQSASGASAPQLVKKFRADSSRLPVDQLLNKYTKQNSKSESAFTLAPAISLNNVNQQPGQQAGR
ncbi:MAG: hypothetical protein VYD53_06545 [Pseudomonadota bacterium]|nr:hypothetical protein [Pseudomonadota bacterium]